MPLALAALLSAGAGQALAQADGGPRPSQGSDQVKTLSPAAPVAMPQATGPFPENAVTDRPYISPEGGRDGYRKTVGALEHALVGLKQLGMQVKQAHWNVSGTLFYPLHIQLQEQYEGIEKLTDRVAERLLSIGASADARPTTVVRTGPLPEIPGGFIDDAQVISWFVGAYKTVAEETKAGIADADRFDPTSSDLLQDVEAHLAHDQWMMRAYVQGTATDPNRGADLNGGKPIDVPSQAPSVDPNGK